MYTNREDIKKARSIVLGKSRLAFFKSLVWGVIALIVLYTLAFVLIKSAGEGGSRLYGIMLTLLSVCVLIVPVIRLAKYAKDAVFMYSKDLTSTYLKHYAERASKDMDKRRRELSDIENELIEGIQSEKQQREYLRKKARFNADEELIRIAGVLPGPGEVSDDFRAGLAEMSEDERRNMGAKLMGKGRYEEAEACFEGLPEFDELQKARAEQKPGISSSVVLYLCMAIFIGALIIIGLVMYMLKQHIAALITWVIALLFTLLTFVLMLISMRKNRRAAATEREKGERGPEE
ncbi:MAG: hypothetical protein IJG63_02070 [Oscillospiraceae bacterium]|nr:hypothetical protein [Oscillospiraceae bacterium]